MLRRIWRAIPHLLVLIWRAKRYLLVLILPFLWGVFYHPIVSPQNITILVRLLLVYAGAAVFWIFVAEQLAHHARFKKFSVHVLIILILLLLSAMSNTVAVYLHISNFPLLIPYSDIAARDYLVSCSISAFILGLGFLLYTFSRITFETRWLELKERPYGKRDPLQCAMEGAFKKINKKCTAKTPPNWKEQTGTQLGITLPNWICDVITSSINQPKDLKNPKIRGQIWRKIWRKTIEDKDGKASSGIKELDTMLGGGIPRGHDVLLLEETGSRIRKFALRFLYQNLVKGGYGIYICLDLPPTRILEELVDLEESVVATKKEAKAKPDVLMNAICDKKLIFVDCFTPTLGRSESYIRKLPEGFEVHEASAFDCHHVHNAIADFRRKRKNEGIYFKTVIVFDSLSTLFDLAGRELTLEFIRHMIGVWDLGHTVLFIVHPGSHPKETIQTLEHIADDVIEYRRGIKEWGEDTKKWYLHIRKMRYIPKFTSEPVRCTVRADGYIQIGGEARQASAEAKS